MFFNMLMPQNEHIGKFGIILWSAHCLIFVCLALIAFLLFIALTSFILGFGRH